MSTQTELVNAALRKVGAARITSMADVVGSAGVASDVYDLELEALTSETFWNFTVFRAQLARLNTAPVSEWTYAYALPSDFVRMVEVCPSSAGRGRVAYKLELGNANSGGGYVRALLTDSEEIWIRYCRNNTEVNLFSPLFRQALIHRLAKIFAISVVQSTGMYDRMEEAADKFTKQAKSVDGIDDYPERRPEGSWAEARRGRGPWDSGFETA